MTRRKRNRFDLPKFDFHDLNLPSIHLPKVNLPKIKLPMRQLVVMAGIVVVVLVMINLNGRLSEFYRLTTERDRLATVVGNLEITRSALGTVDAQQKLDAAAEEFARNSHMIKTGDKLVVALTPAGIPTATPTSNGPTPTPSQNWEVWWALFFGKAP